MKTHLIILFILTVLSTDFANARRRPTKPTNPGRPKIIDMVKNAKIVKKATARIRSKRIFALNRLQLKALSSAATQHAGSFTRLVTAMAKATRARTTTIMKKSAESAVRIADSVKTMSSTKLAGSGINSVVNSIAYTIRGDIRGTNAKKISKISEEVALGLESGKAPSSAFNQAPTLRRIGQGKREKYKKSCRKGA